MQIEGPRYETETKLCLGQEYLFQVGSLGQGITSVIICTTISKAIQFGKVPTWRNKGIIAWVLLLPICMIFSISFNTATMFCPFNKHHELYHPNINRKAPILPHLICYVMSYIVPFCLCVVFTLYHTIKSTYFAYRKSDKAIFKVAQQLRLYPIVIVICVSPIASYFFVTLIQDESFRPLLSIGAILASSSGIVNGGVYFMIIRNSKEHPYSSNHFQEQLSSSLLLTTGGGGGSRHPSKRIHSSTGSKKRTLTGAAVEESESSYGYYDDDDEENESCNGSSAVSNTKHVSYGDDLSECDSSTLYP